MNKYVCIYLKVKITRNSSHVSQQIAFITVYEHTKKKPCKSVVAKFCYLKKMMCGVLALVGVYEQ